MSKSVLDVYKQKFDLENGMVCYNPVDSHELIKYKKEYQIQDKLKICCVGRLEDQKGFDRLIKILGKLRLKNYVVDIYGTGTMKEDFHLFLWISNCVHTETSQSLTGRCFISPEL